MVFKLVIAASKTWRRLKGTNQLPKLIDGVTFQDGIEPAGLVTARRNQYCGVPSIGELGDFLGL
jgi:hypothetical protein